MCEEQYEKQKKQEWFCCLLFIGKRRKEVQKRTDIRPSIGDAVTSECSCCQMFNPAQRPSMWKRAAIKSAAYLSGAENMMLRSADAGRGSNGQNKMDSKTQGLILPGPIPGEGREFQVHLQRGNPGSPADISIQQANADVNGFLRIPQCSLTPEVKPERQKTAAEFIGIKPPHTNQEKDSSAVDPAAQDRKDNK